MSYVITISGHKATEDPADQQAHEESIKAKAQTFASSLEGVNAAYMDGASIGHVDLMPAPAEPATAPEEATPGV